jgi:hypothetical protein
MSLSVRKEQSGQTAQLREKTRKLRAKLFVEEDAARQVRLRGNKSLVTLKAAEQRLLDERKAQQKRDRSHKREIREG